VSTKFNLRKHYLAFGLKVISDISLPELQLISLKENSENIVIKKTDLTSVWESSCEGNQYFVLKKDHILFRLADKAIFMIKNGTEIQYSPLNNITEDQLRLYLLGTCMGAILMQKKILPLHGSAIAIDGKAYAIVGDSGAGKSTLASALLKKGYQLISDDVIPVHLNEQNIPMITPAYPQQKLWKESLNHFGIESKQFSPIVERENKFAIPVSEQFATEPLPLAGVFELVKSDLDEVELNPIQNLQRLHTLYNHTYRNFFITPLGLMDWHFSTTAKMCEHIDLYQLRRPTSRFTAYDLSELIISTINRKEVLNG